MIHFRDAAMINMTMDASDLMPGGFSLASQHFPFLHNLYSTDPRNRCEVGSLRYYFIDFETTTYCPEGIEKARVTGTYGSDHSMPEISEVVPYNPFKLDIYTLGNAFLKEMKASLAVSRCLIFVSHAMRTALSWHGGFGTVFAEDDGARSR